MDDTARYSNIVGVFRDRTNADQAAEALKQAGMREVELIVYDPQPAEEDDQSPLVETKKRILVHVKAEGREQEAVAILTGHGSNNSDLPPGTMLYRGSIVSKQGDTSENAADQSLQATPPEGLFGAAKGPADVKIIDKPGAP